MHKIISLGAAMLLVAACGKEGPVEGQGTSPTPSASGAPTPAKGGGNDLTINGAGATFPYPLYSKWVAEYEKVDPKVHINYQSIGSGGGIKQISERTVEFGASDAPMKDDELAKAPGKLVHIPTTLGAVVVAYNVDGVTDLTLDADTLAGIFLGDVKTWNDPRIVALNPGAKLPGDAIQVAYRSDGSGTTAVFTDYLAAVSPTWKDKVGAGKSVKFPVGLGAKGNEGVAGSVKTTPGSIGYVELAFAKQTGQSFAKLKNAAGKVVEASIDSVSAAAAGANVPEDFRTSIVNAAGDGAYPIAAFTYILVYEDAQDPVKAKAVAQFLWWAIHDGQKFGPALFYAPLPATIVTREEARLKTLKAGGKNLL